MAILLETVESFVAKNQSHGIDLRKQMLWGYFFKDPSRDLLEGLRSLLEAMGYRYVDIFEPVDPGHEFYLHVERIEGHTVKSLHARCRELERFAKQNKVESFDGFDVGNVDGSVLWQ